MHTPSMAVSRHVIAASKAVPTCKIKGLFTFLKKHSCMCLFGHLLKKKKVFVRPCDPELLGNES
jgi:hypothetical protein